MPRQKPFASWELLVPGAGRSRGEEGYRRALEFFRDTFPEGIVSGLIVEMHSSLTVCVVRIIGNHWRWWSPGGLLGLLRPQSAWWGMQMPRTKASFPLLPRTVISLWKNQNSNCIMEKEGTTMGGDGYKNIICKSGLANLSAATQSDNPWGSGPVKLTWIQRHIDPSSPMAVYNIDKMRA